jgi:hypothetical protein
MVENNTLTPGANPLFSRFASSLPAFPGGCGLRHYGNNQVSSDAPSAGASGSDTLLESERPQALLQPDHTAG